jgi:hypothetical protein
MVVGLACVSIERAANRVIPTASSSSPSTGSATVATPAASATRQHRPPATPASASSATTSKRVSGRARLATVRAGCSRARRTTSSRHPILPPSEPVYAHRDRIVFVRRDPRHHGGSPNDAPRLSSDIIPYSAVEFSRVCGISVGSRSTRPQHIWPAYLTTPAAHVLPPAAAIPPHSESGRPIALRASAVTPPEYDFSAKSPHVARPTPNATHGAAPADGHDE